MFNRTISDRLGKLLSSFSTVFLVKFGGAALTFVLSVFLARLLDLELIGKYFIFLATVNLFSVLCLYGLRDLIIRLLPVATKSADKESVVRVLKLSLKTIVASHCVLFLILSVTIKHQFVQNLLADWPSHIVLTTVLGSFLRSLLTICAAYLISVKMTVHAVTIEEFAPRLAQMFAVILLSHQITLELACFSLIFSLIVTLLFGIFFFAKSIKQIPYSFSQPKTADIVSSRKLLTSNMPVFGASVLSFLRNHGDILILGFWLSSELLGVYGVAQRVSLLFVLVMTSINTVVSRKIALSYSTQDYEVLANFVSLGTKTCLFFGLLVFTSVVAFRDQILMVFGEQYLAAGLVLIFIGLGQFITVIASTSVRFLLICEEAGCVLRSQFTAIVVLIIGYAVLIPNNGLVGVGIATVMSATLQSALVFYCANCKISSWKN